MIDLPKWPRLIITGPALRKDEAKSIILRSDVFLTSLGENFSGGNNHQFNVWVRKSIGLWPDNTRDITHAHCKIASEFKKTCITTQYVRNDWASCCYVEGPHGWVSPGGVLHYDRNVGKWPSYAEIVEDLVTIAQHVDFFTAYLFDCEYSESGKVVASFKAQNKNVVACDDRPEIAPRESDFLGHTRGEQGLPEAWVEEFCKAAREWIAKNALSILGTDELRIISNA